MLRLVRQGNYLQQVHKLTLGLVHTHSCAGLLFLNSCCLAYTSNTHTRQTIGGTTRTCTLGAHSLGAGCWVGAAVK